MITLRPNQKEAISKAIEFFRSEGSKPSLIVLPTAWGKSILTAFVAKSSTERMIVLQPTKELLEQNYSKYIDLCGFMSNAGIYSASFGKKEVQHITYATIGSIKDKGAVFKKLGFTKMLIDEAHLYPREKNSMLGKFLKESGITHVLGITATPVKLQQYSVRGTFLSKLVMLTNKSKKGNFFQDIIHVGQVQEMIHYGYWSPLLYEVAGFDGTLLRYNSTKSEYTEESVQLAFNANGGMQSVIDTLNAHSERKHILVFVPSVQDAITLSNIYENSAVIYGTMDKKQRSKAIEDFRSGNIRVLFNVRVLSTGFDYTGIDCIVLGISTASVALYYQIIGRATRINPDKKNAVIVDLGGNVERFGKVEDIFFEKGKIWRMYGTDGRLLSGVPISEIGTITKNDVLTLETQWANRQTFVMPFGRYKGVYIMNIPMDYRKWLLQNFVWNKDNMYVKQAIEKTIR